MKVDALLTAPDLGTVGDRAALMEAVGYDGLLAAEIKHDPFLALALAAERTEQLQLGTCIAVAFPRSPMHLAQTANDLQAYSRGRGSSRSRRSNGA